MIMKNRVRECEKKKNGVPERVSRQEKRVI